MEDHRRSFLTKMASAFAGMAMASNANAEMASNVGTQMTPESPYLTNFAGAGSATGGTGVVNVRDYGAAGDGTTDDTAAIQAALNDTSDGDTVFFPPGTYRCTRQIHQRGTELAILGSGVGSTTLEFTHDGNGLVFEYPSGQSRTKRLTVRNLTLSKVGGVSGTAIMARWRDRKSSSWVHGTFENLELVGTTIPNGDGWKNGIVLDESWHSVLNNIHFLSGGGLEGTAIDFRNQSIASSVNNLRAYGASTAVRVDDVCEGIRITNSVMVMVDRGVVVARGDKYLPQLTVQNTHVACHYNGIVCRNRAQSHLAGNLIYKIGNPDSFVGILLQDCIDTRVSNNCIVPIGSKGANNGIVAVDRVERNVITGNQFYAPMGSGVWLQDDATANIVKNSTAVDGVNSIVTDHGSDNIVKDNLTQ